MAALSCRAPFLSFFFCFLLLVNSNGKFSLASLVDVDSEPASVKHPESHPAELPYEPLLSDRGSETYFVNTVAFDAARSALASPVRTSDLSHSRSADASPIRQYSSARPAPAQVLSAPFPPGPSAAFPSTSVLSAAFASPLVNLSPAQDLLHQLIPGSQPGLMSYAQSAPPAAAPQAVSYQNGGPGGSAIRGPPEQYSEQQYFQQQYSPAQPQPSVAAPSAVLPSISSVMSPMAALPQLIPAPPGGLLGAAFSNLNNMLMPEQTYRPHIQAAQQHPAGPARPAFVPDYTQQAPMAPSPVAPPPAIPARQPNFAAPTYPSPAAPSFPSPAAPSYPHSSAVPYPSSAAPHPSYAAQPQFPVEQELAQNPRFDGAPAVRQPAENHSPIINFAKAAAEAAMERPSQTQASYEMEAPRLTHGSPTRPAVATPPKRAPRAVPGVSLSPGYNPLTASEKELYAEAERLADQLLQDTERYDLTNPQSMVDLSNDLQSILLGMKTPEQINAENVQLPYPPISRVNASNGVQRTNVAQAETNRRLESVVKTTQRVINKTAYKLQQRPAMSRATTAASARLLNSVRNLQEDFGAEIASEFEMLIRVVEFIEEQLHGETDGSVMLLAESYLNYLLSNSQMLLQFAEFPVQNEADRAYRQRQSRQSLDNMRMALVAIVGEEEVSRIMGDGSLIRQTQNAHERDVKRINAREEVALFNDICQVLEGVEQLKQATQDEDVPVARRQRIAADLQKTSRLVEDMKAVTASADNSMEKKREVVREVAADVQLIALPMPEGIEKQSMEYQKIYEALRNANMLSRRLELATTEKRAGITSQLDEKALMQIQQEVREALASATELILVLQQDNGGGWAKRQKLINEIDSRVITAARVPVIPDESSPSYNLLKGVLDSNTQLTRQVKDGDFGREDLREIDRRFTSVMDISKTLNEAVREEGPRGAGARASDDKKVLRIAKEMETLSNAAGHVYAMRDEKVEKPKAIAEVVREAEKIESQQKERAVLRARTEATMRAAAKLQHKISEGAVDETTLEQVSKDIEEATKAANNFLISTQSGEALRHRDEQMEVLNHIAWRVHDSILVEQVARQRAIDERQPKVLVENEIVSDKQYRQVLEYYDDQVRAKWAQVRAVAKVLEAEEKSPSATPARKALLAEQLGKMREVAEKVVDTPSTNLAGRDVKEQGRQMISNLQSLDEVYAALKYVQGAEKAPDEPFTLTRAELIPTSISLPTQLALEKEIHDILEASLSKSFELEHAINSKGLSAAEAKITREKLSKATEMASSMEHGNLVQRHIRVVKLKEILA